MFYNNKSTKSFLILINFIILFLLISNTTIIVSSDNISNQIIIGRTAKGFCPTSKRHRTVDTTVRHVQLPHPPGGGLAAFGGRCGGRVDLDRAAGADEQAGGSRDRLTGCSRDGSAAGSLALSGGSSS